MEAHRALSVILFHMGEFVPAWDHAEQGIALYNPQHHRSQAFLYAYTPGVVCLSFAACTQWWLGYPDQAMKRIHEAVVMAQELAHPFSLVLALSFAAGLHLARREHQAAQEQAEALLATSTEYGFPIWMAWGTIWRGRALAGQGQQEEGIVQMRQGLAAWGAAGAESELSQALALLAEVYGEVGQAEEGLAALAEALAVVDKNGEHYYEAELYRLKGKLSLQSRQVKNKSKTSQDKSEVRSPESEVEECFWKAIEIARRQQAKSLELRAVMSLSRLWQQQGKTAEARRMLAEIYSWFTEGFDTVDLKEA